MYIYIYTHIMYAYIHIHICVCARPYGYYSYGVPGDVALAAVSLYQVCTAMICILHCTLVTCT